MAYSSMYSWPVQQMELSGQLDTPATLPPGKTPLVPIVLADRWTSQPVCFEGEKILGLFGNRVAITKDGSLYSHFTGRSGHIADNKVVQSLCLIKQCDTKTLTLD